MKTRYFLASLAAAAIISSVSLAQIMTSSSVVKFTHVPGQDIYPAGESFQMVFLADIDEGWHTQSDNPDMEGLIATELSLSSDSPITFGRVAYPPPVYEKFEFSEEPLPTFKGKTYFMVTGAAPADLAPGDYTVTATLRAQACDDSSCIAPSNIAATITLKVAAAGQKPKLLNQDVYKAASKSVQAGGGEGALGTGDIAGYIQSKGFLLTFLLLFLGGLALNLTPCVYPLIPITVSYFGASEETSKARLIAKALLYFFGMTVMYSALGVGAALTGSLFGALLQHWAMILFLVAVLTGLAFSMFGYYDIKIPDSLADIGGANRQGLIGAFLMGLTAGIIAAPCIGPFVLGLLTFVGEKGDPLLGFTMFFTLSAGLGAPYVVLAFFSGGISKLPRSGMWMVWVKKVFGFILLGMAIYFALPLIPKPAQLPVISIFAIGAGIYTGFFCGVAGSSGAFRAAQSAIGLLAVAGGAFALYSSQAPEGPKMAWTSATSHAVAQAKQDGVPVILDFTADWCIPCKELDHFTFSDPKVVERSKALRPMKVDLTTGGDLAAEELKKAYKVQGVPTVVFIGPDGAEREDLRFAGFVDAENFLERMEKLLGK